MSKKLQHLRRDDPLKGMTLGASLSTSQLQFVQENFGDVIKVQTYKSSE